MSEIHVSTLDWVLFDADETLFHFDAFAGLQRLFNQFGITFNKQDFADYQQANLPLWTAYQNGEIDAETLQITRFEPWAAKLGVQAKALNDGFLDAMADVCTPLPYATELLNSLRGRVKLGIITNGFTRLQQIRLERTGLAEHFDVLVISEQVGLAKPARGIFEHAMHKMQHNKPDTVLMVGDNPHSDVLGGLNAGMHTCWYNPAGHSAPADITPHLQVNCHSQLLAHLTR